MRMFKLDFTSSAQRSDAHKRDVLHFQYTFGDTEYFGYVSSWLPNNKTNRKLLLKYKYENEHDYTRTEYDCNGSTKKRIKVETNKKRNKIRLKVWCSVDC